MIAQDGTGLRNGKHAVVYRAGAKDGNFRRARAPGRVGSHVGTFPPGENRARITRPAHNKG
ncbi:hypothetical protein ANT2_0256 [plant metagenome]|uniref:Uncharacterized protein n=1 Tax=plant metagenome TaxID=1297885 RepID=A0A484RN44_9ZZZZ